MEWIFRNQETVAARSKYIHQLSSSNNAHPIEYFVYCSMGTVKFELLSWFSIVRDFWRQHFSVLSQKTNNISVVSSHFHLYLRISALRLPTVGPVPAGQRRDLLSHSPVPEGQGRDILSNRPIPAGQGRDLLSHNPVPAGQGRDLLSRDPVPAGQGRDLLSHSPVPAGQGRDLLSHSPVPAGQGRDLLMCHVLMWQISYGTMKIVIQHLKPKAM